jgi:hypothetical protein
MFEIQSIPHKKHAVLIAFKEIIADYAQNYTKYTNTLFGRNQEPCFKAKAGGTQ